MDIKLEKVVDFPPNMPEITTGILQLQKKLLLTGHDDGSVTKWNLDDGSFKVIFSDLNDVRAISYLNNKILVGYRSNGLYILNLTKPEDIIVLQKREDSKYRRVWDTTWPDEDKLIMTSTYGSIKLFKRIEDNKYELFSLQAHEHSVFAIESLNGKYLATGDWSGELIIWKYIDENYKDIQKIHISDTIQDIYWKDENNFIVIDERGKIYLLEKEKPDIELWNIVLEVEIAKSKGICISMAEDKSTIFAATLNELIQFDVESQQLEIINIPNIKKLFIIGEFTYLLLNNGLFKFIWKPIIIKEEVISYRYVKAGLLGHTRTGKSTFCKWVNGYDISDIKSTYGRRVYNWEVSGKGETEKRIILYDHGGQDTVIETFIPSLKDSDILLLFYVQKDRTSLLEVLSMFDKIKDNLSREVKVYLIRTHIDDEYTDITEMEIEDILKNSMIKADIHISPPKNIGLEDIYNKIVKLIDWNKSRMVLLSPLNEGVADTLKTLEDEKVAIINFKDFKQKFFEVTGRNISEKHLRFILNDFSNKERIDYQYISDKIILYDNEFNKLKSDIPKIIAYKDGFININELISRFGDTEYLKILDEWYINTGLSIKFGTIRVFPYKLKLSSIELSTVYKEKLKNKKLIKKIYKNQNIKLTQLLNLFSEMKLQCINVSLNEGLFEWEENAFIYYSYKNIGTSVEGRYLCYDYYIGGENEEIQIKLQKRFDEILSVLYGELIKPEELETKKKDNINYEYDVCLSFAGEQRGYVKQVAIFLTQKGLDVFYDDFEKHKFWGKKMDDFFINVFKNISEFCIMFISNEYMTKYWPSLERTSALKRALLEKKEYILPVKIDDYSIPELNGVGSLDGAKETPQYIADEFIKKWKYNRNQKK